MGKSRVKGIVVEIGGDTVGLNKALDGTNKKINTTQGNLKDVERLLKLDPTNTTLLEQKQRLLGEAIQETENKLQVLHTALDQNKESVLFYDDWKAAHDPILQKMDEVRKKLKSQQDLLDLVEDTGSETYIQLQKEIESTQKTLNGLKEEERAVNEEFGNPISIEQLEALDREIAETELALSKMRDTAGNSFNNLLANIKDTQKELREVDKLLNLNPSSIEMLEQKQLLLAQSIEDTEKSIQEMETAYEDMLYTAQGGVPENEKAFRELERQIEASKIQLKDMKDQAVDTDKKLSGIDEQSLKDVEDAADQAADALENAGEEASTFGDILKAEAIVEGAKGIISALQEVTEETKEYRKIMGSLEVSSEAAGYTADETREAYKKLYGVLDDDQSAATTVANLQALGLGQQELLSLIDNTIGGWAKYGDSIPIDGLAEAINETAKAGQVTGTFADILNWGAKEGETYGVAMKEATEANEDWNNSVSDAKTAEDFFNLALQECSTESERVNLIMQAMADQGLAAAGEKWRENNASMVESNETAADLQEQMALVGEKIEPIATKVTEFVVQVLEWFNSLDSGTQNFILATVAIIAALGPVGVAVGGASKIIETLSKTDIPGLSTAFGKITKTVLPGLQTAFTNTFGFIAANPIVLLIGAVATLVGCVAANGDAIQLKLQEVDGYLQGVFVTDWTEAFGPVLGGILNGFFDYLEGWWNSIYELFNGIIDFIRGVFTGDWERAWEGVKSILAGVLDGMLSLVGLNLDDVKTAFSNGIDKVRSFFEGWEFKWPKLKMPHFTASGEWDFSTIPPTTPKIGVEWYAKGGILKGAQLFGWLNGSFLGGGENGPEAVLPLSEFYSNLETILERILCTWPTTDFFDVLSNTPAAQALSTSVYHNTTHLGGVNIHVYGTAGQDVHELAEAVMEEFQNLYDSEEAALT